MSNDALIDAYTAGDIPRLNQLIQAGQVTAAQAATRYNLSAAQIAGMRTRGIVFYGASVAGIPLPMLALLAAGAWYFLKRRG